MLQKKINEITFESSEEEEEKEDTQETQTNTISLDNYYGLNSLKISKQPKQDHLNW